ncbi:MULTISPECIES: fumarylacetoacetate hydrolase family protein [Paraburkholderia]|uniref:fumarylacetoacetate hydrolase family protein n=1 Tax=Paraburkholderia TaxID=1822464 RepID=UPI000B48D734|nr:hypothetical protein BWU74_30955 [Burkholderia sp. Bk]
MKIGCVRYEGDTRIAIPVAEDAVAIVGRSGDGCPNQVAEIISDWRDASFRFREALVHAPVISMDKADWLPPVTTRSRIMTVTFDGMADQAAAATIAIKARSSLIGHRQTVRIKRIFGAVFSRPALAVVIGSSALTSSSAEKQPLSIFGYTAMNDITAPGLRRAGRANDFLGYIPKVSADVDMLAMYNGTDTFGPLGPFIVLPDENFEPDDSTVSCTTAGHTYAPWSVAKLPHSIPDMLTAISDFIRLDPGDVVAFAFETNAKNTDAVADLAELAEVAVDISGVCSLQNPIERC